MYKKIMLSLLLVPWMVFSKSGKDYEIEQLKKAQRDKQEEIAFIIKAIDEKENLIDSIVLKILNVLENINNEYEDILEELNCFEFDLQQALIEHKSITYLLNKSFVHDSNKNNFELKRIKYLVIRYALEYMNLYKLIEQYEQLLEESLDGENQIKELQQ